MNNVSKKMVKKVKKGKKKKEFLDLGNVWKKWKFLNNNTIREMVKQIKRIHMLT